MSSWDALRWRLLGPFRGGRVVAVAGDPADRNVFYFGSTGGGVWKTTSGGNVWENVSDGYFARASVGAIAVAASDPNVVYAGMGEACLRQNVSHGDGVYRSTDAGRSWTHLGLEATRHIARVRVHPSDPDTVYVAAFGHAHGPNDERGVYRSRDGGSHWDLVLHRGPDTGAADLVMDPANPRIAYASTWEARRTFWSMTSGGEGSGIWRTTDGGDTWTDLTRAPGLPEGTLGRIGVAASGPRVWALVEADDGALFRSDDHGEHWTRLSEQDELRYRPFYYGHVFADPGDADTVWVLNVGGWRSIDGGRTFTRFSLPHGDAHDLWIDPSDPSRLILGDDGGAAVSFDGGRTFSSIYNQPTAELYHVTVGDETPYRVYGAQQDHSTLAIPSRTPSGLITHRDYDLVGGGESGHIAVRSDAVFAGSALGYLTRYDRRTQQERIVHVWPDEIIGHGARDARYRFAWSAPVLLSPHDPSCLYLCGNHVFRSRDDGQTWEAVSGDLSRAEPSKLGSSGGLTPDNSGAEYHATVVAFAESPLREGTLWAGTDDGRVHLTRDGGATWTDVTPSALPDDAYVGCVEPSPHDPDTAYLSATRHMLDDLRPFLFRTRDAGETWTCMRGGLPDDVPTRVVRCDPGREGLLFAGTETGVLVSLDDGGTWEPLRGNLPVVPVHDLAVAVDDLVAATHGRSFWVLDDITPLRAHDTSGPLHLYEPRPAVRHPDGAYQREPLEGLNVRNPGWTTVTYEVRDGEHRYLDAAVNAPDGVWIHVHLPSAATVRVVVEDASGEPVRTFEEERDAGLHRLVWDMRHEPAPKIAIDPGGWTFLAGPMVPPGDYTVRVETDGASATVTARIVADPDDATTAEQIMRTYRLRLDIWRRTADTNRAVDSVRSLRRQIAGRTGDAAARLDAALRDIDAELTVAGARGNIRLGRPKRLCERIQVLAAVLDRSHGGPTRSQEELADELFARSDAVLARLDALIAGDVAAYDASGEPVLEVDRAD